MDTYPMYVDGHAVTAADGATFASYEPATGQQFAELPKGGGAEARQAVDAARRAFDEGPWPRMSGVERAAVLAEIAARIGAEAGALAELEVRDSGATLRKATTVDVPAAQAAFEWSARWAAGLADAEYGPDGSYLRWDPVGVVATLVPWNFPLLLAAWRIAPVIAAGNTCVVKPASFTSVTASELVRIMHEAGLPPGVVNLVLGPGAAVGDELVRHPAVDLTTFTGSNEVGAQVLAAAGGRRVKLDVGGKSANIVLADADLDRAVSGALWGCFLHNGQVCMAGARALVHRDLYPEFLSRLGSRIGELVLGDPLSPATGLGPMVSRQQVRTVARFVGLGLEQGATLAVGGARPDPADLPGLDSRAYYLPTVLADVKPSNVVFQEEIFGPVLSVTPFDTDDEAVSLANDSRYGLSGAVWSSDVERAVRVADRLLVDRVWVNDYRMVDVAHPGVAAAGYWDRLTNDLDEYRVRRRVYVVGAGHFNPLYPVLGLR